MVSAIKQEDRLYTPELALGVREGCPQELQAERDMNGARRNEQVTVTVHTSPSPGLAGAASLILAQCLRSSQGLRFIPEGDLSTGGLRLWSWLTSKEQSAKDRRPCAT